MEHMPLQVTLVANAGVLLRCGGTVLLLDGVFTGEGHPFSAPSAETVQQLLDGRPPFAQIDYLLFTHRHPDHFSSDLAARLLECRPVRGVLIPEGPVGPMEAAARRRHIPVMTLSGQVRRGTFPVTPEITVRALRTPHLGERSRDVLHFCYLITFGDKRVLFTADADDTPESLAELGDLPLRAAFLNPLIFRALRRSRGFRGVLRAEQVCVYHVPFSGEDPMGARPALAQEAVQWQGEPFPLLLCAPFQRVDL